MRHENRIDENRVRRDRHRRRSRRRGGGVGRGAPGLLASRSARCRPTPSRTCRAIRRSAARRRGTSFARSTRSAGLMGRAIDATGIQFKLLNRSRGPAVWSPRAQADKRRYSEWVRDRRSRGAEHRLDLRPAGRILIDSGRVTGLALEDGDVVSAAARWSSRPARSSTGWCTSGASSGRRAAPANRRRATWPSRSSRSGFAWGRLKTGTPPRLDRRSIDFSRFERRAR